MQIALPNQGAFDRSRAEPSEPPEPRCAIEAEVPLQCLRISKLDLGNRQLTATALMSEQQIKDLARACMESLPDDSRNALADEFAEVR